MTAGISYSCAGRMIPFYTAEWVAAISRRSSAIVALFSKLKSAVAANRGRALRRLAYTSPAGFYPAGRIIDGINTARTAVSAIQIAVVALLHFVYWSIQPFINVTIAATLCPAVSVAAVAIISIAIVAFLYDVKVTIATL